MGIWFAVHDNALVRQKTIHTDNFGDICVAHPLFGSREQVLVFVDTKKFHAKELAKQIALIGTHVAIVDAELALKASLTGTEQCLDIKQAAASINTLMQKISMIDDKPVIVSGINDGALLPFLTAETRSKNFINLSIDFSAVLPSYVTLCPAFLTNQQDKQHVLISSPGLGSNWRSVWNDHPPKETALFVRGLPEAKTWIAPYDTPLDTVLAEELQKILRQSDSPSVPLPIVEVPAAGANETITIFYSGDGGWRDLDRIVAQEMARQGYPVVGVDALRGFWSRKTPGQAADELAGTLDYYRKAWGAKNFVLAGYSFGADILPPIYNRLTQADQESVRLLILLAPSRQIDFEIHVSGWVGKDSGDLPMATELARLPEEKILCIYGQQEKGETACTDFVNTRAERLELPGGHHFDEDYPKLTQLILEKYQKAGLHGGGPTLIHHQ